MSWDKELLAELEQPSIDDGRKMSIEERVEEKYSRLNNELQQNKRRNPTRIKKLYEIYFRANQLGEEISMQELAKRSGFNDAGEIQVYLKRVGLKPLLWEKHLLTRDQEDIVNRARHTDFAAEDVCYFGEIKTSDATVVKKLGRVKQHPVFTRLKKAGLTYRLASQVYYGLDAGHSVEDLLKIIPTLSKSKIELLEQRREEVAPNIITNLRKLIGDKNLDKPYLLPVLGGYN